MKRSLFTVAIAVVLVSLAASVSACTSGHASAAASPSPTKETSGDNCPGSRQGGKAVFFGDTGSGYLAGYLYGTGKVGIVFGHESDGDACDWMYEAKAMSASGYMTLAIDFDGYAASTKGGNKFGDDIDDAVTYLGTQGATSVVLWGSSMGADAVLAGASGASLPVDAVIALSPPIAFGGADGIGAAKHITVPLLLAVGEMDTFDADTNAIYRAATATKHKQLIVEPSASAHGRALMSYPDVVTAIKTYLSTYAPPAGTQ